MSSEEKAAAEISKYEPSEIPPIPRRERNRWKICIPNPFQNCERIYPIQQRKVAAFLSDLRLDDNVRGVVIFGSSVTDHCHIGSDVDLYVELEKNKKLKLSAYNFVYDLWTNFTVDARMLDEIIRTGVIVYERDTFEQSGGQSAAI